MKVLIKFPTRSRPQQFLTTLSGWISQAVKPQDIAVLVSYDADDATMTPEIIAQAEALHPAVVCWGGASANKIAACNRDLPEYPGDWQVVLLVSDDFFCRRIGWDDLIRDAMKGFYPDTDGCLWFHDGTKQRVICTLSCVGKAYYQRDRYLYHPSYASFFCDNEFTDVARSRGKITFIENGIATHEHPAWGGGMKPDALYQRNNKYWAADKANFYRRKELGFPA